MLKSRHVRRGRRFVVTLNKDEWTFAQRLFDQASIISPGSIVWSRTSKKLMKDPLLPSLLSALVIEVGRAPRRKPARAR